MAGAGQGEARPGLAAPGRARSRRGPPSVARVRGPPRYRGATGARVFSLSRPRFDPRRPGPPGGPRAGSGLAPRAAQAPPRPSPCPAPPLDPRPGRLAARPRQDRHDTPAPGLRRLDRGGPAPRSRDGRPGAQHLGAGEPSPEDPDTCRASRRSRTRGCRRAAPALDLERRLLHSDVCPRPARRLPHPDPLGAALRRARPVQSLSDFLPLARSRIADRLVRHSRRRSPGNRGRGRPRSRPAHARAPRGATALRLGPRNPDRCPGPLLRTRAGGAAARSLTGDADQGKRRTTIVWSSSRGAPAVNLATSPRTPSRVCSGPRPTWRARLASRRSKPNISSLPSRRASTTPSLKRNSVSPGASLAVRTSTGSAPRTPSG